jgi:hypothetical protein
MEVNGKGIAVDIFGGGAPTLMMVNGLGGNKQCLVCPTQSVGPQLPGPLSGS